MASRILGRHTGDDARRDVVEGIVHGRRGGSAKLFKSHFKGVNIWVLIASSSFWAWYDSALFMPTFFDPFEGEARYYSLYFAIAMASTLVLLLVASLRPRIVVGMLSSKKWEFLSVGSSIAGCAMALAGATLGLAPLIAAGAFLVGVNCSYFMLAWSQMYSLNGARSAAVLLSGSMAGGVLIDLLAMFLDPLPGALFVMALVVVVMLVFYVIREYVPDPAAGTRGTVFSGASVRDEAFGSPAKDAGKSEEGLRLVGRDLSKPFGISVALFFSFFVFGILFGFLQIQAVQPVGPFGGEVDTRIMVLMRGLTALAMFVTLCFSAKNAHYVLLVGLLVGMAGVSCFSVLGLLEGWAAAASPYAMAVGFASFEIVSWTFLAELAFNEKKDAVAKFGPGRFSVQLGILFGFAVSYAVAQAHGTTEAFTALATLVGYLLVVAIMLMFMANTDLWTLVKSNLTASGTTERLRTTVESSQGAEQVRAANELACKRLAEDFDLTRREGEVLEYLLMGRSRSRIAEMLSVSENTVNTHINHIYHKLDVHGYQEFLDLAFKYR